MWRFVLAGLVVLGSLFSGHDAAANGRPPGTASIHFRQGHETDIVAGMTFGLVISHDGGTSWYWMCEDAIGYKGMYDPRYVYSDTGALFATTFNGLKVERNACTFDAMPSMKTFVSAITQGPDHSLMYAAAQSADPGAGIVGDSDVYRSTDDGMTFPTMAMPGQLGTWWQSLEIATSNVQRAYLSGYRYDTGPGDAGTLKVHLLYRTDNAGQSWAPLPITDFTLMPNSVIDIVGVSKTDPNLLYARVELEDNTLSDAIYRSTNGGQNWTRIYQKNTSLSAFVVRANGDIIVGTQTLGAEVSHDKGANWLPLANPPHMNCMVENAAGEVWACTQNYGGMLAPSDDAGIMKSVDLVTWTKVLRYQDLKDPVDCAAGTVQHDGCAPMWCAICSQLGCTPSAAHNCPVATEAGDTQIPPTHKAGCCDSGEGGAGALALGLVVGMVVIRPRRRGQAC